MITLKKQDIPLDLIEFFEPAECGKCYVCNMCLVFDEVWRVLRDDSTLFLNMGDSYAGSWGSMSHDQEGKAKRSGSNNRPPSSYPQNGLKPKDLCGMPWRLALGLAAVKVFHKECRD